MFEKEEIPDADDLYFFIHHQNVTHKTQDQKPQPKEAALGNTPEKGPNKSCDWSAYSTPKETLSRLGKQYKTGTTNFKDPKHYFVYSHKVEEWRNIHQLDCPKQEVEYDPIFSDPENLGEPNNKAHTIIIGTKSEKLRTIMARKARWPISPPGTKAEMKAFRKRLNG
ncbi:MAG: hypothetical protein EA392_14315 [Cryomorphaceae bacterium]|nr:MAG: hypothetical protein EA392_14315 [Cryomorphaceae bacterium]